MSTLLSIFTDPRRLPCEHVFCAKCLEAVIGQSRSRSRSISRSRSRFRKLTCPVCRGEHQLSENEFPKAYQVNRLIEMYQGMAASSTKKVRSENEESVCCAIHITQIFHKMSAFAKKLTCTCHHFHHLIRIPRHYCRDIKNDNKTITSKATTPLSSTGMDGPRFPLPGRHLSTIPYQSHTLQCISPIELQFQ